MVLLCNVGDVIFYVVGKRLRVIYEAGFRVSIKGAGFCTVGLTYTYVIVVVLLVLMSV